MGRWGRAAEVQKQRWSMASALLTVGDGGSLEIGTFGIDQLINQPINQGRCSQNAAHQRPAVRWRVLGVERRLCRSVRISGAPLAVSAGNAPVSAQPPLTAGRSLISGGWFGTDLRPPATEWHAVDGSDDVECAPNSAAVTETAAAVNRRWQPPMATESMRQSMINPKRQ